MSSANGPEPRRKGGLTGVVAVLALIISVLALFLAVFRDPFGPVYKMSWNVFGNGLGSYDFSTPAEAMKSRLKIEQARDVRAMFEYSRQVEGPELKERIDTLEVKKEEEVKLPIRKPGPRPIAKPLGAGEKPEEKKTEKTRTVKLLFITYKENGEVRHRVEGFDCRPSGSAASPEQWQQSTSH